MNPYGALPETDVLSSPTSNSSDPFRAPSPVRATSPDRSSQVTGKINSNATPTTTPGLTGLTGFGNTSASASAPQNNMNSLDTLDEPVMVTLKRDLLQIWHKLKLVMIPHGNKDVLKDWDLWGPLLLCLLLSIVLGSFTNANQQAQAFTSVFALVWAGAAIVTVNARLLGGRVSFFQSVCVIGYCIFPLCIASIIIIFIPFTIGWLLGVRLPIVIVAWLWSVISSRKFLDQDTLDKKRMLVVYPIFLFYFVLGFMVLMSATT